MPMWTGMRIKKRRRRIGRLLVKMIPNLPEGNSCIMALSMVDVAISTAVPIHVFNLHSYPVVIKQDSMVG